MKKLIDLIISILFLSLVFSLNADQEQPNGNLCGKVINLKTQKPLYSVNVFIPGLDIGTTTDESGKYFIKNLPVGSYTIHFQLIGYKSVQKTDVIIKSNRYTNIKAEMIVSAYEISEVIIKDENLFQSNEELSPTVVNFSNEEIRRAPGSAGDVSRIIMNLPSVAKVNDQSNNLIVRGGSPIENSFYLDNIEIPNINHFPTQGSSGGPIGLINVELIQDVNFSTGGFTSLYGNRLSSIMNLKLREGNKQEFDGQIDLNFAGFGGVFEGPIKKENGSWILSARRSYLDFLVKNLDLGTSLAPSYGDLLLKTDYNLNNKNSLSILVVNSDDHSDSDHETAIDNDMLYYGNQDIYTTTAGINWKYLWNKSGYSNTSISYSNSYFKEDFYETGSQNFLLKNRSKDETIKIRNTNYFSVNKTISLDFGVESSIQFSSYNNKYSETIDMIGNPVPASIINRNANQSISSAFFNISKDFNNKSEVIMGLRYDYNDFTGKDKISPRFSYSYKFTEITKFKFATGYYYQDLPIVLLSQQKENKKLKTPESVHYILGLEQLLTADTKLSVELYYKNYKNFPLDPAQPGFFILDEIIYDNGFYSNHEQLKSTGKAYSKGIEVLLQKKLASDFYGLTSFSYFRSRYKDYNGIWRNRIFDNRYIFSIEGGYKPNYIWEFSLRWIYAGGTPYTPFDIEQSQANNRGIIDESLINERRYSDYHSLNVRIDRRFHMKRSNLVCYISIWNVYNQKNIASYFWNTAENKKDKIYQWGMLPIFGLEYEF